MPVVVYLSYRFDNLFIKPHQHLRLKKEKRKKKKGLLRVHQKPEWISTSLLSFSFGIRIVQNTLMRLLS